LFKQRAITQLDGIQWRNYERRDEAIASGRLAHGGALSRSTNNIFCFATEFRKTAEISKNNKLNDSVDILTEKQTVEDRKYWRCVLDRIMSLIITMSKWVR